ncbi:MAG: HD-GYP domain-containing protein [Thermosipho sp. (in: Bacteria)]|nr:HD-GYP domain-containing protein [Thermosipho sp. (in: thermotogales)]
MVLVFIEWKHGRLDFKDVNFYVLLLFFTFFEGMAVSFELFVARKFEKDTRTEIMFSTGVIINVLAAAVLRPGMAMLIPFFGYLPLKYKVLFSEKYLYFLYNSASLGIITYLTSILLHFTFNALGDNILVSTIFITSGSILYFALNILLSIFFVFAIYGKISKDLVELVTSEGKLFNVFATSLNTLIIYVLYSYIGIFAIPLSLFTFITIQLSNYYATKYRNAKIELLMALIKSLEEKDPYTAGHGEMVAEISSKIAEKLDFQKKEIELIKIAGVLHDIGKIGIPDIIILKKDKLTEEEYMIMKEHPKKGFEILKQINEFEETVAKWVLYHHERWDGKGYPEGLKGEEIPLESRIITIADVYHALISDRPYRKALSKEEAVKILKEESGKFFDPKLVEIMLDLIKGGKI